MRPEQVTLEVDGRATPCLLHTAGGERSVAVVLPGSGYTPGHPLLWFVREALEAEQLAVLEVWWNPDVAPQALEARAEWGRRHAEAALAVAGERFGDVMVVGKSLGTLALAEIYRSASTDAAGIWLTPLLALPSVLEAVERVDVPTLLVVGGADVEASPPESVERARAAGHEVLEVDGADHALEVGDPVANLGVLKRIVEAVRAFADGR